MEIKRERIGRKDLYESRPGRGILSRTEFIRSLANALKDTVGFAAGRLGISEQFWMYYPILKKECRTTTQLRVFEKHLFYHASVQGIFPLQAGFLLEYNDLYLESVRKVDGLGLILDDVMGPKIVDFYRLANDLYYFKDQIYDKSSPSDPANCYLQYFEGKKLLIICPFAEVLRERAEEEVFEGVWRKTGRKWFHPAGVDALEFPYGFAGETQARYGSAINLLDDIQSEIVRRDFDVALVAAAGLSIPIDSFVKRTGKVSLSLGGDLQVLFGVMGNRWRGKERWKKDYFNEWWIDLPEKYRPKEAGFRNGAYW